jgi:hypothetical protein
MDAPALGRLLGAGKEAEFLRLVAELKLYRAAAAKRSAFREAANAAVAESLGLPVPKIHGLRCFGDRWGILMSLAEGPSFAESIRAKPNLTSAYLTEMGLLQFRVHGHPGTHFASLKARLAANIRQANGLDGQHETACWRNCKHCPRANVFAMAIFTHSTY